MGVIDHVMDSVRRALLGALVIVVAIAGDFQGASAMQAPESSTVRIVHGIVDVGPLDVYVDGSLALIGIEFGDTSDGIALAGGARQFAVTPTGSSPNDAIVSGPINLEPDVRYYASLLGSSSEASVGLFRIDDRALETGRARFRVINGVADAGEIVPVFTGGDALSEPLGFGDVTEYTTVDAGTYDIDILDAVSGGALLSLPQTPFAEAMVTDIFIVGLLADGTMQSLVATAPVEVIRAAGLAAIVASGNCAAPGELVADLGLVRPGSGADIGVTGAPAIAQGYGLALATFDALLAGPHAVVVQEGAAGTTVACGDIGGRLTDTGALVIALLSPGTSELAGVAVLAPGLDDPETTGVSVFVTAGAVGLPAATPAVSG